MVRLLTVVILLGAAALTHPCFAFCPTNDNNPTRSGCSARNLACLAQSTQQEQEQTTEANPRLQGLALMLDDGTRQSHSIAENTAFVTGFFKGVSTREAYSNLMTSLYLVYHAMETGMDETSEKNVKALDDPVLRRLPLLKKDLNYFHGLEWNDGIVRPSPATSVYVARIQEVAKTKPYLLIGHQYSRYLGDLFGGVMMGNMARRSLDLQDEGVAFYQFDAIDDTKEYISEWYTRLKNLDLTDQQKKEIVDEANLVFALNIGIFEELEGSSLKALWTMGINTLKMKLGIA